MAGNNQYLSGIRDIARLSDEVAALLNKTVSMAKEFRQISYATVISVSPDKTYCTVYNEVNGTTVNGILAHNAEYWNSTGYPIPGDMVFLMHAREAIDAHVIAVVHNKMQDLNKYDSFKNNDQITVGAFTA